MFQTRICALFLVVLFLIGGLSGQSDKNPLTNSDVVEMVQAGLSESTVILAIKNGTTSFDTSPHALNELKKSGVSQGIMDAMLGAGGAAPSPAPALIPHPGSPGLGNVPGYYGLLSIPFT